MNIFGLTKAKKLKIVSRNKTPIHYCKLSMLYKCLFHYILVFFCAISTKVQIGSQYFRNNFPVINVILCKIDMQLESLLKSSHRKDTLASSTTCQTTKRGGRRREMDGNKFSFYEFWKVNLFISEYFVRTLASFIKLDYSYCIIARIRCSQQYYDFKFKATTRITNIRTGLMDLIYGNRSSWNIIIISSIKII